MTVDQRGNRRIVTPDDEAELAEIDESAEIADRAFQRFRELQTVHEMNARDFLEAKDELRQRLHQLSDKLDRHCAAESGIDLAKLKALSKWLSSHQPFHWLAEFYGVIHNGGFDVVFGNPPYVEYSKVRKQYEIAHFDTLPCGNLYAFCIERSYKILRQQGRFGFIVQAPIVSTQRMAPARNAINSLSTKAWYSTYDDRPSKLFDGMHHCRLAIILACKLTGAESRTLFTTRYYKWYAEERGHLFSTLSYLPLRSESASRIVPKFRSELELQILDRIKHDAFGLGEIAAPSPSDYRIYYKITGVGHWFTFTLQPPRFWRNGQEGNSTRENCVYFTSACRRDVAFCCLWSTLHYWLYQATTNCRDFNPSDLASVPVPKRLAEGSAELDRLARQISEELERSSEVGAANYAVGGSVSYQRFRPRMAKALFDEVDRLLAQSLEMTPEETDFIVNYDIKYRMGQDEASNDE